MDRISFDVAPGEWVLLVGHNGAGKSTLLKVLSSAIDPDSGKVEIDGKLVRGLSPAQLASVVFSVYQDPLLGTAPLLTVFENLLVADPAAHRRQFTRKALTERYTELLRPIGLDGRLKQTVKILSGGERQLLALIIAQLREAPVILLDEPLASLDPSKMELCISEIGAMHQAGKTIIQVAHDIRVLQRRASRVISLSGGRLSADAGEPLSLGVVPQPAQ